MKIKNSSKKLWVIKAAIIIFTLSEAPLTLASIAGPDGRYEKGSGIVWSQAVSATVTANQNGAGAYESNGARAGLFAIRSSQGGGYRYDCQTPTQLNLGTSSDGKYTGIKLAEDVIIVFSGNASGQVSSYNNYSPYSGSGTWSSTGVFNIDSTYQGTSGGTWCGIPGPQGKGVTSKIGDPASFTGTVSLYIGPNALPGTYSLNSILLAKAIGWADINNGIVVVDTVLVEPFSIEVTRPPLTCSISTPPIIDFGIVNLWNFSGNSTGSPGGARRDVLSVIDGNLSISCTSDSPDVTTTAKLTLNGPTEQYINDLKVTMDNTNNTAPATIRASMMNLVSACGSNGLRFAPGLDNLNQIILNQLGTGQTNIPYRFSLCAKPELGINQFGSASAQATITLDWD